MSFQATFKTDSYTPDGLVAGNSALLLSAPATVLSGQGKLARGTVMARYTSGGSSGKWCKSVTGGSDGSQTPAGILVDDIDATSADTPALVYTRGDFNAAALTLGASHTVDSIKAGLVALGIFLLPSQP